MKKISFIVVFVIACLSSITFLGSVAKSDDDDKIYIKVGEANIKKSLMAMPPFLFLSSPAGAPNFKTVGADLFNTVTNDLEVSNLFTLIKQAAFLEDTSKTGLTPAPASPGGFNFE